MLINSTAGSDEQFGGALASSGRVERGPERQAQRVVIEPEMAGLELHAQFAALEHTAILIAEHRQQHFVFQLTLERHPIDVEEPCVG
jgi:hypothetical protein